MGKGGDLDVSGAIGFAGHPAHCTGGLQIQACGHGRSDPRQRNEGVWVLVKSAQIPIDIRQRFGNRLVFCQRSLNSDEVSRQSWVNIKRSRLGDGVGRSLNPHRRGSTGSLGGEYHLRTQRLVGRFGGAGADKDGCFAGRLDQALNHLRGEPTITSVRAEPKRLALVVGNLVQDGLGGDTNTVTLFDGTGSYGLPPADKSEVARGIVEHIVRLLEGTNEPH